MGNAVDTESAGLRDGGGYLDLVGESKDGYVDTKTLREVGVDGGHIGSSGGVRVWKEDMKLLLGTANHH